MFHSEAQLAKTESSGSQGVSRITGPLPSLSFLNKSSISQVGAKKMTQAVNRLLQKHEDPSSDT